MRVFLRGPCCPEALSFPIHPEALDVGNNSHDGDLDSFWGRVGPFRDTASTRWWPSASYDRYFRSQRSVYHVVLSCRALSDCFSWVFYSYIVYLGVFLPWISSKFKLFHYRSFVVRALGSWLRGSLALFKVHRVVLALVSNWLIYTVGATVIPFVSASTPPPLRGRSPLARLRVGT